MEWTVLISAINLFSFPTLRLVHVADLSSVVAELPKWKLYVKQKKKKGDYELFWKSRQKNWPKMSEDWWCLWYWLIDWYSFVWNNLLLRQRSHHHFANLQCKQFIYDTQWILVTINTLEAAIEIKIILKFPPHSNSNFWI